MCLWGIFWVDLLKTDSSPPTVWPTNNRAVRDIQVLMSVGLCIATNVKNVKTISLVNDCNTYTTLLCS